MTRACCFTCRLRFEPVAATVLRCCPQCGGELGSLQSARDALGLRLLVLPAAELDAALAAAMPPPGSESR